METARMKTLWMSLFSKKNLQVITDWLHRYVLTYDHLIQALVIICALLLAFLVGNRIKRKLSDPDRPQKRFPQLLSAALPLTSPLLWLFLQLILLQVAIEVEWPHNLLTVVVNLLTVWIVIQTTSLFFSNTVWIKLIAVLAWSVAALNIMGLLGQTVSLLDRLTLKFGALRISLLTMFEGLLALVLLIWAARTLSRLLEKRIQENSSLSPSIQVLFIKLSKAALIATAFLLGLRLVGIDLSAFTIFTGAVGVGIGFGLQKIASNLISGIILLLDKSIKPGDVITVGETYGWVNSLGARYTSLITQEGKEFLIPNEDLITQQVENWSFSNSTVRLKIPVGIAYSSDVRTAMALCEKAAGKAERIIRDPPPICLLIGFGDSSVDLELQAWIDDPANGIKNVTSEILLNIWDAFHEQGIEIPFPQRDVHIKTMPPGTGGMASGQQETHR